MICQWARLAADYLLSLQDSTIHDFAYSTWNKAIIAGYHLSQMTCQKNIQ